MFFYKKKYIPKRRCKWFGHKWKFGPMAMYWVGSLALTEKASNVSMQCERCNLEGKAQWDKKIGIHSIVPAENEKSSKRP